MKKHFEYLNFEQDIIAGLGDNKKISNQLFLIDEHRLNPIRSYEFTAPENIFVEVLSGRGYVTINGKKYTVRSRSLIAYLKGQRVRIESTSKNAVQRAVAFTDEYMEDLYHRAVRFSEIRLLFTMNPVVGISEELAQAIEIYVSILRILAAKENADSYLMSAKMATLSFYYGTLHQIMAAKDSCQSLRVSNISSNFFSLLERNFQTEHRLEFYAGSLNISRNYLYECVVAASGKSPSYWIDYHMIAHAKNLLADDRYTSQMIADNLNFAGLPQFSKFFKKHTGMSPSQYRKSLL